MLTGFVAVQGDVFSLLLVAFGFNGRDVAACLVAVSFQEDCFAVQTESILRLGSELPFLQFELMSEKTFGMRIERRGV